MLLFSNEPGTGRCRVKLEFLRFARCECACVKRQAVCLPSAGRPAGRLSATLTPVNWLLPEFRTMSVTRDRIADRHILRFGLAQLDRGVHHANRGAACADRTIRKHSSRLFLLISLQPHLNIARFPGIEIAIRGDKASSSCHLLITILVLLYEVRWAPPLRVRWPRGLLAVLFPHLFGREAVSARQEVA